LLAIGRKNHLTKKCAFWWPQFFYVTRRIDRTHSQSRSGLLSPQSEVSYIDTNPRQRNKRLLHLLPREECLLVAPDQTSRPSVKMHLRRRLPFKQRDHGIWWEHVLRIGNHLRLAPH